VGEIVLVMVGILLALQVNNWNEERKKQKLEIEILTEIQNNLKTDLEDHQKNISFIESRLKGSAKLLDNIKSSKQFNDSIGPQISRIAFAAPHANPVMSGYNRMIASDAEIISNDSIRAQISLIYENHYTWLSIIFKESFLTQTASLNELILKNFIIKESNSLFPNYEPKNFINLKSNSIFLTTLEAHMKYWEIIRLRYMEYMKEIEEVIANIDNEIIRKG
jgi:hypothetical protein